MTTARHRATDYLVLDMSTLRFQWNPGRTACAALTSRGEILAVVDVDAGPVDQGEVVFRLLDHVLDRGEVLRTSPEDESRLTSYRVALYNPFSAEVSAQAVPRTVTFSDGEPLVLEADGMPAAAITGGRSQQLRLHSGRVLAPRDLTFAGLTRLQEAHQAA